MCMFVCVYGHLRQALTCVGHIKVKGERERVRTPEPPVAKRHFTTFHSSVLVVLLPLWFVSYWFD